MKKHLRTLAATLALIVATAVLMGALHGYWETEWNGSSAYNSYTRQALAWREGLLHLPENVPHLELAVYEDAYYVSFPPVPTLPQVLCTALWGMNTPDNALVALYGLLGCLGIFYGLRKVRFSRISSALYAFFFTYANCQLPLLLEGAVWYQAQTLAFALTAWAVALMLADHPTPALFLYALAVGCRPFNVLYGPVLMGLYALKHKEQGLKASLIKMNPGITLGLMVAAGYAIFNAARFGNPLEFGHNYLPEFSTQGGVQFSLNHVANNARTFLWGLPFDQTEAGWTLKKFGFSCFIACPMLAWLVGKGVWDGIRRTFSWQKALILGCFVLHLAGLLLHRTFGGFQFGARYTVDLLLYGVLYLAVDKRRRISWPETVLYLAGFAFSLWGALQLHL